MNKPIVNMAASVRQRLLNIAQERKEDFGLVLTKYGLERVLYRIAQSKHREIFILKGALLFELWTEQRYRPTRDADFLASGQNDPDRFVAIFREMCEMSVENDGLEFDPATVTAEQITEDADYRGIRIRFIGRLDNARIPIQIDLGFGDVITPAPVEAQLPTLLALPPARLLTYPRESVVAEKFEALVSLGLANSRMKDLHDIRTLSREFAFDGGLLAEAVRGTFKRRGTKVPAGKPFVFTAEFFANGEKKKQWSAFCTRNKSYVADISLQQVCGSIERFLMPVLNALQTNTDLALAWTPENFWV